MTERISKRFIIYPRGIFDCGRRELGRMFRFRTGLPKFDKPGVFLCLEKPGLSRNRVKVHAVADA